MTDLTHFDGEGRPIMVDVSGKASSQRAATAQGHVVFSPAAYAQLTGEGSKKGDVAAIAELAGIMGAKRTADLIPLCHPLPLSSVTVQVHRDDDAHRLIVEAEARTQGQTGVEMEALTAVSVACLTVYDMAKAIDKAIVISDIRLLAKTGGKSGDWSRSD